MFIHTYMHLYIRGCLGGLIGSMVADRSTTPGLKTRPRYFRWMFHLSLRFITFRGRSSHLAYIVHKGCRKTVAAYMHAYTNIHTYKRTYTSIRCVTEVY